MRRAALLVASVAACAQPGAQSPGQGALSGRSSTSAEVESLEEMVAIPAGSFVRGHARGERADESPPHAVRLHAFWLDRTLVTREAFERFVDATGYRTIAELRGYGFASKEGMNDWEWERVPHGSWRRPFLAEDRDTAAFLKPDAPVVMVSYADALAYCGHRKARLPTEAEWEYAMRAGSEATRYPWGDDPKRDGKMGLNFWQGSSHRENLREDGFVYVSPVRAFPPNAWGLYDPVGNVWQWTADWYAEDTYARAAMSAPAEDPKGPESGRARVLRGGSWWCGACTCEGNGLFYRGKTDPESAFNNNGFRCAKDR